MICEQHLHLKEKDGTFTTIKFSNYQGLINYVQKNKQRSISSTRDIIYSKTLTPQEDALALLKKIKSETRLVKTKYSKDIDEFFDRPEDSDLIDIHEFIEEGKQVGSEIPFVKKYNEDDLRSALIEQANKENRETKRKTSLQIKEEVEELLQSFRRLEDRGYYFHILANQFFKGTQTVEGLVNFIKREFPKPVADEWLKEDEGKNYLLISELVTQFQAIRNYLFRTYGSDCKINANVGITADLHGMDKQKLYANVDLIIIDNEGVPHVCMFKMSRKHQSEQTKVKILKRDYYLGTVRHMLAQHGFNTQKTGLSIINVQIHEDENEKIDTISMDTNPIDRRSVISKSGSSMLTPETGKIWNNLSTYIPVTLQESIFDGTIYRDTMEQLDQMFPTHNIKHDARSKTITSWIKKHVRITSREGYAYEFTDKSGNVHYIKEDSPKETNSELREAVAKYLDRLSAESVSEQSWFLQGIKKSVNDKMPLHGIVSGTTGSGRISIALQKYTNGDWKYLSLPKLEELGIACIQNKLTGQLDFILLTHLYDLTREINLGFGTTILGSFLRDSQISSNIKLKATNGNIQFIKLLIALSKCAPDLQGKKIGELKVMNISTGETLNIQNSQLFSDYKQLCKVAKIEDDNIKIIESNLLSDLDILKNRVISLLSSLTISDKSILTDMFKDLEVLKSTEKKAIAEECQKIINQLKANYEWLDASDWQSLLNAAHTPEEHEILNLYKLVMQTYMFCMGDFFGIQQMQTVGTPRSRTVLNGAWFVTADVLPYRNEANLTRGCLAVFQKIRRDFTKFKESFFEKEVKRMWKEKGYSQTQNMILGNQRSIYRNLFREKDGKLDPNLMFKNENDPTLSKVEKDFLKKVLWLINRRRFNLESYSEESEHVRKTKEEAKDRWYWVPLQEAASGSKINSEYYEDSLKQEVKEIISFGQSAKDVFRREEANVYTESEYKDLKNAELRNEVYVRYTTSDSSQDERTILLQSKPLGFWETNVENIILEYELAYKRKEELDKVLPHIATAKLLIEAWGFDANVDVSVNADYLNNFVKQAIHNVTLLSDQEKEYSHLVRKAKSAASYAMIVGNAVAPIRDTLEGIWKGIGIFVGDTWGKDKGFNKSEFIKAYQIVLSDSLDGYSGVTVLESLNAAFGISDMDYQQLARKTKSGKVGLFNFKDKLWWTTTAGDYTNRMVILIAKMLHDGCFEACTYKGGFKYDMKKDKRFGNDAKHLKGEARGLYLSMLRDFNEAGYDLKDGDDLPYPYTPQEIVTLKSFSDRLYGYYDHDLKIQAEKLSLGSIFLQFCTYLTANKTQWFLSPELYETNVKVQKTNAEGKPLYWKRITDENGEPYLIVTDEVTDEPCYVTKKSYMEGIYYTLKDFCADVKSLGFRGAISNIRDCEAKQQNIRLLAYKLLMWLVIGAIVKSLLSMWKKERKKDKSPYTISRALQDEGFDLFYRAMNGSLATFNLIDQFGGKVVDSEPPALAVASNIVQSTFKFGKNMIKGNEFGESLDSWIHANSAAYRSVHELVKGVKKARAAINNSAE